MPRTSRSLLLVAAALALSVPFAPHRSGNAAAAAEAPHVGPRLGVEGSSFTLDGKRAFLLCISYYAALGAEPKTWTTDLDQMHAAGFNGLRVWANWNAFDNDVSAVDAAGHAREPYLGKLKALLEECGRRGMVLDVTLTRGGGAAPRLRTPEALRAAVETLVTELRPYPNWYLDVANERNIRDDRYVSFEELATLIAAARRLDPAHLFTASQGGDITRDELRTYLQTAKVDFICPHRPRNADSAAQTREKTREYLAWMRQLDRERPVHYQEPFRRGYGDWQPGAEDFAADYHGAQQGSAAGWCFHNGGTRTAKDGRPRRSFDLRDGPLFEQLDAEEHRFVETLLRGGGR